MKPCKEESAGLNLRKVSIPNVRREDSSVKEGSFMNDVIQLGGSADILLDAKSTTS